ncbi:MAG: nucleotidyltransferase domain-containing protein [Bacteroidota bacterium]
MNSKTRHIALLIRKQVTSVDPAAEIILYGSRAHGDARKDSDWDILVLTEDKPDVEMERKFRNRLYDLELETGESFSVFAYSKSDWESIQRVTPFFHNVTREGILL